MEPTCTVYNAEMISFHSLQSNSLFIRVKIYLEYETFFFNNNIIIMLMVFCQVEKIKAVSFEWLNFKMLTYLHMSTFLIF